MGMFKDLRKMQKAAKQYERPKLRDAMRMGADAMEQAQANQELVANGIDGQATIRSLEATGMHINNQPQLRLELSVEVNGFTREVTHTQAISPAVLPQLQPGATVACKVDPDDHSKLVI